MPPLGAPLVPSKFNLAPVSTAGLFGDKEAIGTLATIPLYKGRRWLGWYNAPGSSTMAKMLGRMANARIWEALFPGPNYPPALGFGLDGYRGPQYIAALSGVTLETGHLGYLTMEWSKEVTAEEIKGRETTPVNVTYLAMKHIDHNAPMNLLPCAPWGLIPISVSVVTCIMCALVYDWFIFSVILAGIIANGLTCVTIGGRRLVIKSVWKPAEGAPPGHGILVGEDGVVVIKGREWDVNVITKGRFDLIYPMSDDREYHWHAIGLCSLLLFVPVLLQLFLIPQGTLFGQLMFLFSLGVSWMYNLCLSSFGSLRKTQTAILVETLGNPEMRRFRVGTRTMMTVFTCLLLFHGVEFSSPEKDRENRDKILKSCIPNDTDVWRRWKKKVVDQMLDIDGGSNSSSVREEGDLNLPGSSEELLRVLLADAQVAFKAYQQIRDSLPVDSSHHERW